MQVLLGMAREWFDLGVLTFLDRMDVDPVLTCIAIARVFEFIVRHWGPKTGFLTCMTRESWFSLRGVLRLSGS